MRPHEHLITDPHSRLIATLRSLELLKTTGARRASIDIANLVLSMPEFPPLRGSASHAMNELRDTVLDAISKRASVEPLALDSGFIRFAQRTSLSAARFLGMTADELQQDHDKTEALVDHLLAHYQLLLDVRLNANSYPQIHSFSLWKVGEILKEVESTFGSDPKTAHLARTATHLVIKRAYCSVNDAKRAYDQALMEAEETFGSNPETQRVTRTAALAVFCHHYTSMEHARVEYLAALDEANRVFGESLNLARTAANYVFSKKYGSMKEAKRVYDKALAEAHAVFESDRHGRDIARTAAGLVFSKKYPSIKNVKEAYASILAEAVESFGDDPLLQPLVRSTAYYVLDRRYDSVAHAQARYHEIHEEAVRLFADTRGSPDLIRTTSYLVFKGTCRTVSEARLLVESSDPGGAVASSIEPSALGSAQPSSLQREHAGHQASSLRRSKNQKPTVNPRRDSAS